MGIEFDVNGIAGGVTLLVDGHAQSHVDPADPTRLFFEYVRRIGHVIDAIGLPGEPIRALHLGGGGLTLPRYVEATRPGSHQLVVEHDAELVRQVRERLPLPAGADLAISVTDASTALPSLAPAAYDLVVLDLYTGLEPPAFTTDRGFLADALDRVAAGGVLVANVADAAGLARLRELARVVARVRPGADLLVAGDPTVLGGAEEGNAVLAAAPDGLPRLLEQRLRERGPHPAEVLVGPRLDFVLWDAC
ncbi:SAM-dependent methyltransferase [Agromyces intestinalis]|uniref:SAM-dependent methyltransferase n=1 Tax=Agromyces intestinalis TaxID=2592652 RepID=A0A5C1YJ57_9MICO|nr:fused MFS/spermidine synthase [Agromyces intestinalis]QEO15117.1 SAM-dependent methyltransferase [Agromyces intestinalis]